MFLDLILVVGLLTGCQTFYFWDLSQLYPRRFEKLPLGVPVLAGALLAGGAMWLPCHLFWRYLALVVETMFCLFITFRNVKLVEKLLFSGLFSLILLCFHGVAIPLLSTLGRMNMYRWMTRSHVVEALLLALVLSFTFLMMARNWCPPEKWKPLLRCDHQKMLLCGAELPLLAYLLLESGVYYYDVPFLWTPMFHLITSLVALAVLCMVVWYALDVSAYIEYELKTRQVEKQLQRQLVHYQQYTRHISEVRAFKHDYKRMCATLQNLVNSGAKEKALNLLGQMTSEMERQFEDTPFSNHLVVDAILRECASRCREAGIQFSAVANLPARIGMNDLELCRIFGNLVENAYEAVSQETSPERFLEVSSGVSGNWVTVSIVNSYTGDLKLGEDGLPLTRKKDKSFHGLGLRSVRQLVEAHGGFLQLEVDQQRKVFMVRLHFCCQPEEQQQN